MALQRKRSVVDNAVDNAVAYATDNAADNAASKTTQLITNAGHKTSTVDNALYMLM